MSEEMSSGDRGGATPADLAAEQVESIVAAAQEAADGIRTQAQRDAQEREKRANQEAESIRGEARRDATRELDSARRKAARLGEDARQEAQTLVEESRAEANELREHTRQEVAGRVEGAEQAAEEVLAEARALSAGLRRLGQSLGEQAERILRDVQGAHKRMRADLRAPVPEREGFELRSESARGRRRESSDDPTFELPEIDAAPSARRSSADASSARRSSGDAPSARRPAGDSPSTRRSTSPSRRGTTRPGRPSPEPQSTWRAAPADAAQPAGDDGPFDLDEAEAPRGAGGDDDLDVPSWLGGDRPG